MDGISFVIVLALILAVLWGVPSLLFYYLDKKSCKKISETVKNLLLESAEHDVINLAIFKKGWEIGEDNSKECILIRRKETSKTILVFLLLLAFLAPVVPIFLIHIFVRQSNIVIPKA